MTSVIMIAPLNANNFESGNADEGQVLTADGAGRSEWRAPTGTGGGGIAPIQVTGNWAVPSQVMSDITASTGLLLSGLFLTTINLWAGGRVFGILTGIAEGNDLEINNVSCYWGLDTPPTDGFAYIVGIGPLTEI